MNISYYFDNCSYNFIKEFVTKTDSIDENMKDLLKENTKNCGEETILNNFLNKLIKNETELNEDEKEVKTWILNKINKKIEKSKQNEFKNEL